MLKTLQKRIELLDDHFLELIKKSSSSLVVKISGLFFGLAVSVLLARNIGPKGLGIINLSNRIINILLLFGLFGVQNIIVKIVSIGRSKGSYEDIGNVIHTSTIVNGLITIFISFLLIIFSKTISINVFKSPDLVLPLQIALSVMVFQVLSRIYASGLIGYKKIWQSNLVDQTLSYFFIVIFVLTLIFFDYKINVIYAALIFAFSRILVTLSTITFWKRTYIYKTNKHLITSDLLKKSFPLFIATVSTTIINNLDLIVLGILSTTEKVGIYSVAAQIALIPRTILIVVNSALSPQIASLFKLGKIYNLEKLIQRAISLLSIISLIGLIIIIITGSFILKIWGSEFKDAYLVLAVLSFGQFYNLATGPTGITMIMCDLEKTYRNNQLMIMSFSIIASIVLTYLYGIIGIAIAQALTIILNNSIQIVIIKSKVGIQILPKSFNFFRN